MTAGRVAEAGCKVVIHPEFAEALLLNTAVALQNFAHGSGEIVIDQDGKDAAEKSEGLAMRIEEGLLALTGVEADKVRRDPCRRCGGAMGYQLRVPSGTAVAFQERYAVWQEAERERQAALERARQARLEELRQARAARLASLRARKSAGKSGVSRAKGGKRSSGSVVRVSENRGKRRPG